MSRMVSYVAGVGVLVLGACGTSQDAGVVDAFTEVGGGDSAGLDAAAALDADETTPPTDTFAEDATAHDATAEDVTMADATAEDVAGPVAPHLTSLAACWKDVTCPRVFVISHGGDWDFDSPYGSKAAFDRAYALGADGIKTDFLVTKDNIGVVAHSSPIESFESPDCQGRFIEEMTADEVTACHLLLSETATFQRVDEVIEWARGKLTIMLTVKSDAAFDRAVSTILELDAADFVFIETHFDDQVTLIPTVKDWEKVYFNSQIGSLADLDVLETTVTRPQILFCEMDPSYEGTTDAELSDLLATRVHGMGMRSFVSSIKHPEVAQHQSLFDLGFDVIMSYNLAAGVQARKATNTQRGVAPP